MQHYVFFFPDEMRASALHCYGNSRSVTPNFDRLAAEGTLFEQNYTAHPVCVASRCSLMTGWYPHVNGFRTLENFLNPRTPNFLRNIHDAGYDVHVYGKNHMFDEETYFSCVDHYLYVSFNGSRKRYPGNVPGAEKAAAAPDRSAMLHPKDYSMLLDPMPDSSLEDMNDTRCIEAAVHAIENWKEGDRPLFIFLPTFYPHAPYTVPEHFYHMYDPASLSVLPPQTEGKPSYHRLIRSYRLMEKEDPSLYRKIMAVYLGMVSYSDLLLGRVLNALDRTGLSGNTTVIASSDHGDWAGDWGLPEKWPNAFDDDLTRVPLIIRRPGCLSGHRVKELTQTFDIFPTICDWENIPVTHDQFGLSLKAQTEGASGDPDRAVWCEGGYDIREPQCFEGFRTGIFSAPGTVYYPKLAEQQKEPESVCRGTMMRTADRKLVIRTNGENELYDMKKDPQERTNLYADPLYRKEIVQLEEDMLLWLMKTSDVVPRNLS